MQLSLELGREFSERDNARSRAVVIINEAMARRQWPGEDPFFFFQAEDGIRDFHVTGVQTCALPILKAGKTYHVELAFVDRRLTLAIDGSCPFPPVDFPRAERREGVERPVKVGARGVRAVVRNEIGRASCRERVENAGGGGSGKKKQM